MRTCTPQISLRAAQPSNLDASAVLWLLNRNVGLNTGRMSA